VEPRLHAGRQQPHQQALDKGWVGVGGGAGSKAGRHSWENMREMKCLAWLQV
jgi:hypothetical protein